MYEEWTLAITMPGQRINGKHMNALWWLNFFREKVKTRFSSLSQPHTFCSPLMLLVPASITRNRLFSITSYLAHYLSSLHHIVIDLGVPPRTASNANGVDIHGHITQETAELSQSMVARSVIYKCILLCTITSSWEKFLSFHGIKPINLLFTNSSRGLTMAWWSQLNRLCNVLLAIWISEWSRLGRCLVYYS